MFQSALQILMSLTWEVGNLYAKDLKTGPINLIVRRRTARFKLPTWGGIMIELYWLTDAQVDQLWPFFPESRGKLRVMTFWC